MARPKSMEPITFSRPRPSSYVLLVAETGPGTGQLEADRARRYNLEGYKPAGTQYATDADLREAGYLPASELHRALAHIDRQVSDARRIVRELQGKGSAGMQVALSDLLDALDAVSAEPSGDYIEKRTIAALLSSLRNAESREAGEAALEALQNAVETDGPVSRATAAAE